MSKLFGSMSSFFNSKGYNQGEEFYQTIFRDQQKWVVLPGYLGVVVNLDTNPGRINLNNL
jgi:hypothetical protein